ncbi:MAG: hypothetical protein JKY95_14680, partial [Planctomycetaceae bacterium]|nr:hypothetical protein [Planctomycetaceae bacterium]
MTFIQSFPTISLLLGNAKTDLLDEHSQELPNTSFEEIKRHQEECSEGEWCKLNTGQLCQNELINIEAILAQILKSPNINDEKLRRAFSSMAKNPDQFEQLRAEIVTAATAESRATLLDLDWKTGKKDYDADVRMEINDEPVNLEVTLRTDNWLKAITVHMEDIIDEQGNQINKPLGAKSRRTLTDLERSDSEESGIKSPIRVESMMSPLKQSPRQIQFISNSEGIPEGEQQKT